MRGLHRSPACRPLRAPSRALSQPAIHQRDEAAGPAGRGRPGCAVPQGAGGARPILQEETRAARSLRSATRTRTRSSAASRAAPPNSTGSTAGLFRAPAEEYAGGLLRRSDLWRQSRHVRVEDDRLSRRALRLSRLGRPPQRALIRCPPVEHRGPGGVDAARAERRPMARKLPNKDVVDHRPRLDGLDHGARADRRRARRRRDRARAVARHARPIFRRPTFRTNCAIASATSCSCGRSRPPSPSATRWTRRRCRSAPGARSCRRTASAAAACTGTRRPGASCRPTSC